MIGTSLGPYQILEQLGAGGMGEVYLAEDTRLSRKVAVKVLPEEFASVPERLARFEQEARAAAALNHPHIAVVHDVGSADGTHYMVQEHLEGESLRELMSGQRLAVSRVLELGAEIAAALAAAHGAGVVHRDLKPDNVFVTREGHAKVLDFGLAKLIEPESPPTSSGGSGETATALASARNSPSVLGTAAGQVLGTAGYMAPEQVNGQPVDARADVFSFGCVLYEMATGRQPFAGRSMLQTLDKIVHDEPPPLDESIPGLPAQLHWIVRKCLAKEPRARYQHADDLAVDLRGLGADVAAGTALSMGAGRAGSQEFRQADGAEGVAGGVQRDGVAAAAGTVGHATAATRAAAVLVAAAALVTGAFIGARWWADEVPSPGPSMHFRINLPNAANFTSPGRNQLALSRDGTQLALVLNDEIWLRRLADEAMEPIRGTDGGARAPFFSPDGREVGFWRGEALWRVATGGGTAREIVAATNPFGVFWADDGTIYYGQGGSSDSRDDRVGIWSVPVDDGTPRRVVSLSGDARAHNPWLLPGGEALLFALKPDPEASWDDADIVVQSLDTDDRVVVHQGGSNPRYVDGGHLLFARDNGIWAVPFDLAARRTSGTATPVLEGVQIAPVAGTGWAQWALADDGTVAYLPGTVIAGELAPISWIDSDGGQESIANRVEADDPRLSRDGRYIAVEGSDSGDPGIWIFDLELGSWSLLTTEGDGVSPVWSPDGAYVYFVANDREPAGIWRRRIDFTTPAELVWASGAQGDFALHSISLDGRRLVGIHEGERRISMIRLGDEATEIPLLTLDDAISASVVYHPSEDWIAYSANDSGEPRVYARSLAEDGTLGPRHTLSTRSGVEPVWSPDGATLYYIEAPALMAVDLEWQPTFRPTSPRVVLPQFLTAGAYGGSAEYDVARDGRFLTPWAADWYGGVEGGPHVRVIVNWFAEWRDVLGVGQ